VLTHGGEKVAGDVGRLTMVAIDRVIQAAHFLVGEFTCKRVDCGGKLWISIEDFLSNNRGCVVRRKIVSVIF